MPEILRHGNLPPRTYTCDCSECGSQLRFQEHEGRMQAQRFGCGQRIAFTCPVCSTNIETYRKHSGSPDPSPYTLGVACEQAPS